MAGKFALLIGNSHFNDAALARLAAPENDVVALREVLRNPQISGFETSLVLNAGMDEARTAVARHFQNRDPDDLLLFYYTGHGLRGDDGELYLSLPQTDSATPSAISLEASYVRGQMDRSRSQRQVIILDCCHSGAFAQDLDERELTKRSDDQTLLFPDDFVPKGRGSFVLAASSAKQSAFEKDGKSLFTQYLVEALETGQAAPSTEDISVQDLYGYVSQRVASVTERMRPRLWPEGVTEPLYIARNLDPRTPIPPELLQMLWDEDPHRAYGAVHQLVAIYRSNDERQSADVERAFRQRLEKAATLPHLVAKPIEEALSPSPEPTLDRSLAVELEREQKARADLETLVGELRLQADTDKKPKPSWLTPMSGSVVFASLALATVAALSVVSPDAFDRMAGLLFQTRATDSEELRQLRQEKSSWESELIEVRAEREELLQQRAALEEEIASLSAGTAEASNLEGRLNELEVALKASLEKQAELSTALAAAQRHAGAGAEVSSSFTDCTECPEMVVIPDGTFTMGSPADEAGREANEGPQREVTVQRFALAKTEVTFDQWQSCVDDGGCRENPDPSDRSWGRGSRPVINVSWNHVQEYIAWLNGKVDGDPYRLPSEAEWEFAVRAGTTTPFAFGETISTDQANYDGNSTYGSGTKGEYRGRTVGVEELQAANDWGLRHMHGNVWEWVEDCWHGDYTGAPTDGSAWLSEQNGNCDSRVVRGGSWYRQSRRSSARPSAAGTNPTAAFEQPRVPPREDAPYSLISLPLYVFWGVWGALPPSVSTGEFCSLRCSHLIAPHRPPDKAKAGAGLSGHDRPWTLPCSPARIREPGRLRR